MSPSRRSLAGRVAAHERWSRTPDRAAATAPARAGFLARFERQVDPDASLAPEVRAKLAESALKAHMARLALSRRKSRTAAS